MGEKQHQLAQRILPIIRFADANELPTYKLIAEKLCSHPRPIAQACDLLDAAAALAGIPLLALVKVLNKDGIVNPKAWKKTAPDFRDRIIRCSQDYTFTDNDFAAIEKALIALSGYGNRAAWDKIRIEIPDREQLLERLITPPQIKYQDAVDDLGSDSPQRKTSLGARYARDPKVRKVVEDRAKGKCEFCGDDGFVRISGSKYLETHHIIALAKDGKDRITNVIALCANHHREAHFGERRDELEKMMIAKVKELCMKTGRN